MSCTSEYSPTYNPWTPYYWGYPYPYFYDSSAYLSGTCCTVCCKPYHLCSCREKKMMQLPQELVGDTASVKKAFIGGTRDAHLTLEYLPVTVATANVKLVITAVDGTVTTVDLSGMASGYHVKDDFAALSPGANITLEVTDCQARLRWCEVIAC